MNPFLEVFILSLAPISELRGAIPYGILVLKLEPLKVFLISIFGNILCLIFLIYFLEFITSLTGKKSKKFKNFLTLIFKKTEREFSFYQKKYQNLALLFFVALPFPFTGAWAGSLIAFLFGFEKKRVLLLISGGILIAGIIVWLLTFLGVSVKKYFGWPGLFGFIFLLFLIWYFLRQKNKL